MADIATEGKRKLESEEVKSPAAKKIKDEEIKVENGGDVKENGNQNGVEKLSIELPDEETLNSMSEEAMKKTLTLLQKGKYVADKYVEALTRAYDIFHDKNPDVFNETQQASLEVLQNFKKKMTEGAKYTDVDEDSKKAFAYHIEVCKSAMPEIFSPALDEEEGKKDEEMTDATPENPIEALFKKGPFVSLDKVFEMCNSGTAKLTREKNKLKEELQTLHYQMQISDELLSQQVLEVIGKEAESCWRFFHENADTIFELYSKLGKGELVVLSVCRDIITEVFEKLILCRENWLECSKALHPGKPSFGATSLVCGPKVPAEKYEKQTNTLIGLIPEQRNALQQLLTDYTRKLENSDKFIVEHEKSKVPAEDEESYQFILKDLPSRLTRAIPKPLAPEERLYIGFHLNVIKSCVGKMQELTIARKCLEGKYIFRKEANKGRDFKRRDDRFNDRNRGRFGGGGDRGRRGGFDHRSAY